MSLANILLYFVLPLVVLAWVACGIWGFYQTWNCLQGVSGSPWWRYAAAFGAAILLGPIYLFNAEIGARICNDKNRIVGLTSSGFMQVEN